MANRPRDPSGRFLPTSENQVFTGFEGATGAFTTASPTPSPLESASMAAMTPRPHQSSILPEEHPDDFQDASDVEHQLGGIDPIAGETSEQHSHTPEPTPAPTQDDAFLNRLMQTFAAAINTAHAAPPTAAESRGSKMPSPDKFNGEHPEKLRTFFLQGELHFRDRPRDFPSDAKKVMFMISHLEGTALDWFEPHLSTPILGYEPAWLNSYPDFQQELRLNFGPLRPAEEAEAALETLVMKHDQRIQLYMVQFNRWATLAQWGDRALTRRFYIGLPNRLKDALYNLPGGKPNTLANLRIQAMTLDARYWERKAELTQSPAPSGALLNSSGPRATSTRAPAAIAPSTPVQTSVRNATPQTPTARQIPGVGSDGKLTVEERQRRISNNLCLFCGNAGHVVKDCRKRTSAMNARASRVNETSGDESEQAKQ
jgi:hypothetical protein